MPSGLSRGWSRIDKATFLTPDEKRAAVGYGPLDEESPSPLRGGVRGGGSRDDGDALLHGVKYRPDQARDEIGRWTDEGGRNGADSEGRVRLAQVDGQRRYSVNLDEEEVDGGHTLRDHVRKTDEYLLGEVNRVRLSTPDADYGYKQKGSFLSEEAANDFVNRVLENNKQLVDKVASGEFDGATLNQRFGYVTGKEAIKEFGESLAYVRPTYDVRVRIRHDTRSPRGYRVFTAFPRNRLSGE